MTGLLAGAVLALAAALLVVHDVKVQFRRAHHPTHPTKENP